MSQSITIPESDFRDELDGSGDYLLTTLTINGADFHVEAFAVVLDESGNQVAVTYDQSLDAVRAAVGGDGRWETVTIFGREYVLVITPYCD